jgi:cell division cycle protein 37
MQEERERKKAAGEVDEEEVELSKEERMGPGGLDPVEVFETLPDSMKEAFESQETQKLHVRF